MNIIKIGKLPTSKDLEKHMEQRVIPIRFCYPDIGGNQWHNIRKDNEYNLGNRELTALKRSISDIRQLTKDHPTNVLGLNHVVAQAETLSAKDVCSTP